MAHDRVEWLGEYFWALLESRPATAMIWRETRGAGARGPQGGALGLPTHTKQEALPHRGGRGQGHGKDKGSKMWLSGRLFLVSPDP